MCCNSASTMPKALDCPLLALQPTRGMHHQQTPSVLRHTLHQKDACRGNAASRTFSECEQCWGPGRGHALIGQLSSSSDNNSPEVWPVNWPKMHAAQAVSPDLGVWRPLLHAAVHSGSARRLTWPLLRPIQAPA